MGLGIPPLTIKIVLESTRNYLFVIYHKLLNVIYLLNIIAVRNINKLLNAGTAAEAFAGDLREVPERQSNPLKSTTLVGRLAV